MTLNDPANLGFVENKKTNKSTPSSGVDEENPNQELHISFYSNDNDESVEVKFSAINHSHTEIDQDNAVLINQLIAIADNTWLSTLSEQNQEVQDTVLYDKLHAIFHSYENEPEGKKFLLRVSKSVEKLLKDH